MKIISQGKHAKLIVINVPKIDLIVCFVNNKLIALNSRAKIKFRLKQKDGFDVHEK